ncbi:MAG: PEP-CTERM sorting domain-containing protein [Planctomycetes bacterium]|nr:PEP-CTERM sorting domain-containing protein [Planctomycetota bacterium]
MNKLFSFSQIKLKCLCIFSLLLFIQTAGAAPIIEWDYSPASNVEGVVFEGLSHDAHVTGTSGGGTSVSGESLVTRWFGSYNPYVQLEVTSQLSLDSLSFTHSHNHNPYYSTYGGYDVQLQLDSGNGFSNIGQSVFINNGITSSSIDLSGVVLDSGIHTIRWEPFNLGTHYNYGGGYGDTTHTGTEFFAIDNVMLEGAAVPEPTSMALMGLGLAGMAFYRKKRLQ